MAPKLSEQQRRAWRSLLYAHRVLIDTLEDELTAESSLPLTSYEVLARLDAAPEKRLRLSELADSLVLSRSGVTRLVDRLERDGLVRRENCPSDRRGSYATLTEEGALAFRAAAPIHSRGIEEHFARHLSDAEARILATALERVIEVSGADIESLMPRGVK